MVCGCGCVCLQLGGAVVGTVTTAAGAATAGAAAAAVSGRTFATCVCAALTPQAARILMMHCMSGEDTHH